MVELQLEPVLIELVALEECKPRCPTLEENVQHPEATFYSGAENPSVSVHVALL